MIQPPTDNLYKFIAIAGIVMFAGPWFIVLPEYRALQTRRYELDRQVAVLEEEVDYAKERIPRLEARIEQLLATDPRTPDVDELIALNRKELEDLRTGVLAFYTKPVELRVTNEHLRALAGDTLILMWYGRMATTIGAVLMVTGFSLWYRRLQRYQDHAAREGSRS